MVIYLYTYTYDQYYCTGLRLYGNLSLMIPFPPLRPPHAVSVGGEVSDVDHGDQNGTPSI